MPPRASRASLPPGFLHRIICRRLIRRFRFRQLFTSVANEFLREQSLNSRHVKFSYGQTFPLPRASHDRYPFRRNRSARLEGALHTCLPLRQHPIADRRRRNSNNFDENNYFNPDEISSGRVNFLKDPLSYGHRRRTIMLFG